MNAEWIKATPYSQEYCNKCGLTPKTLFGWLPPFCPNCGAKMQNGKEQKPMNEMKPEDVMRALECCLKLDCKSCPYYVRFKEYTFDVKCGDVLIADALALLREKDAEIERLKAENDHLVKEAVFAPMERANFTIAARAEAITEFAEKTIEWCRKKLKFDKYQTIGLSGKRLEGYEAAMRAVMSYMHSLKSKDDFPNCKVSGCEAARKDCHIGCPYGKENTDDSGTKV